MTASETPIRFDFDVQILSTDLASLPSGTFPGDPPKG
jgi:hypothetical protein